jgi:hypothetical protein
MWLRLDDGFGEHPKIVDLSDKAFRVHVLALLYCARNLTDGRLPARYPVDVSTGRELVRRGLWAPTEGGGWVIHDWSEWNPSAEAIRQRLKNDRERKRRRREDDGNP